MTGQMRSTATAPRSGDSPLSNPTTAQRNQVLVIGVVLLATTVTSVLAAFSKPPADALLYSYIRDWSWVDGVSLLSSATSPAFLAALAALLVVGWRCRTFLVTAAGTILAGLMVGWLLVLLVGRERPADSATTGADSFPSLGLLVLAILAGLPPAALASATGRSSVRRGAPPTPPPLALGPALAESPEGLAAFLTALACGDLALDGSLDADALAAALIEVPGIGPWSASYVALRTGEPDAFPVADAALLRAMADLTGARPTAAGLLARADRWRPWRAYAAMHLWSSLSRPRSSIPMKRESDRPAA